MDRLLMGLNLLFCLWRHLLKENFLTMMTLLKFPRMSVPQHLDLADDEDLQQLSEALGAAKTRSEGCSSFLKAAIRVWPKCRIISFEGRTQNFMGKCYPDDLLF